MALDGCFLNKAVTELNAADDAFVDKIYQPSKDELVFLLRKKGFVKRLIICVKPGLSHINFTENKYENPAVPPMFCMLIRKHLSAARLIKVTQPGVERIAELVFSATNEMGDITEPKIICELIGNKTNIILTDGNGTIIDSLRRSDPETSERMILPGAVYKYPENQDKLNPLTCDPDEIAKKILLSPGDSERRILDTVGGFSPLVCREIIYKTGTEDISASPDRFKNALFSVINDLKENNLPIILFKKDGTPADFSFTDISQYAGTYDKKICDSFSALIDEFYSKREKTERIKKAASDIIKLVGNLRSRTEKKLAIRLNELQKCSDREKFRIYGELLKANLYKIENGSRFFTAENFYDEMKPMKIPLDPALSPQKNAAKYFKEYKKTYTMEQTLTVLTEKDRQELIYFDSVSDSISRCESVAEINEIREELAGAGYIKNASTKKKKSAVPSFKEYHSADGFKILVGKNNRQNDYITTELANKNDLWFHVKNIPGSHVVIFCGGKTPSDETLTFAASLAAKNSKASSSSNVPVDFTPIKFVRKPSGAKPGMVIYTTNKTIYVTPKEGNE